MYNRLTKRLGFEACLAARTRRLHRAICSLYDDHLRELGITVAQLDILVTLLCHGSPIRPIDLAREMLMERSTVSRNLTRLAHLGLVKLMPGRTHREQLIRVTAKGQRTVARAEEKWADAQDAARVLLTADGAHALELMSERVLKGA